MKYRGTFFACVLWLLFSANLNATGFEVGICTHAYRHGYEKEVLQKALGDLGVSSFRDAISWEFVEKQKGEYAIPASYELTDSMLLGARSHGLSPLLILDYGNPLYESDGLVLTDEARAGFANYAAWMVRRYKGSVRYYEIWNEWYLGAGSKSTPRTIPSVSAYVDILKAVYPVIKRIDPDAVVLAGATGDHRTDWYQEFARAGGLEYVDGMSVHPYVSGVGGGKNTPEASLAWVEEVHNALISTGGKAKDMYVSEVGWPAHDTGYSDEVVGAYLARYELLARTKSYIKGVWWYDLYDDGPDSANREYRFGLLAEDGREKPAFKAMQSSNRMLQGVTKVWLEKDGPVMEVIAQGPGGKQRVFSWTPTAIPGRKAPLADYIVGVKALLAGYDGSIPQLSDRAQFDLAAPKVPFPVMLSR